MEATQFWTGIDVDDERLIVLIMSYGGNEDDEDNEHIYVCLNKEETRALIADLTFKTFDA